MSSDVDVEDSTYVSNDPPEDLPYARDDEPFLQLVDSKYPDEDLYKYEPPSPVYSDPNSPGYMGNGVTIPPGQEEEANKRFQKYQFNAYASDIIPLNRSYPDMRDPKYEAGLNWYVMMLYWTVFVVLCDLRRCLTIEYPPKLPQTSVILVIYNENWTTLLRTIWSICNKSPRQLLREIILFDDGSDHEELGQQLDDAIAQMPCHVELIRTNKRNGIIRAKLIAVRYAKVRFNLFPFEIERNFFIELFVVTGADHHISGCTHRVQRWLAWTIAHGNCAWSDCHCNTDGRFYIAREFLRICIHGSRIWRYHTAFYVFMVDFSFHSSKLYGIKIKFEFDAIIGTVYPTENWIERTTIRPQ